MENKRKINEIFNDYEQKIFKKLENLLLSAEIAILDIIMYYEDVCLRSDVINYMVDSINRNNFIVSISRKIKVDSGERRNHNIAVVLELIIRKNITKFKLNKLSYQQCEFNENRKVIEENIEEILDYYDLYLAKNALESGRYDVCFNEKNTIEFINKDYNTKYNIQGHLERVKWNNFDSKEVGKSIENSNENLLNKIYNYLVKNLFTLKLEDNLGVYSVKEFIEVWSIIYYLAINMIVNKNRLCINKMCKYIEYNSDDIESYFNAAEKYIKNYIVCEKEAENRIQYISLDFFKMLALNKFQINNITVENIINDLIYQNHKDKKFSLEEYPFLSGEKGIIFSGYYIVNEIALELLMKKKSKVLYKDTYDRVHTQEIEPRICKEIETKFSRNKRFKVRALSDVISKDNGLVQSQIDIFLYDINKKDIMIIEVKDHIEKLDTRDVVKQVQFEMNMKKKGNVIKQLKVQNELIKIQKNLNKYIQDVSINDINNIYLGYCETYYAATPKFLEDLKNEHIVFMPYKYLLKKFNCKSLKELYDYFYHVKYIDMSKFANKKYTIDRQGYKFIIPTFDHVK